MGGIDPWQVLGVSPDATLDEVKAAYKKAALRYHGDVCHGNPKGAERTFVKITEA